jgi:ABC-type nitrate/sulfonate/bicarbonate transport system ATPase subunit
MHLRNVSHYYLEGSERHYTLEGIDFSVEEGRFVCILGPSGCGKSTLLNLLAGFLVPCEGSISMFGQEMDASRAMIRDIKVVMQHANLFPWLTVQGNVEFGLRMRGVPKAERASVISELLTLVGLTGVEGKFPSQLSGGMQQRVSIARALAPDPKILLMDEPFGALDAQMRRKMQLEILRIWSLTKKTIVFVTHDIVESVLLADSIVVLSASPGRVKRIVPVSIARPRERARAVYDLVSELEGLVETVED